MTFDTQKTWLAMNCVEAAAALGYNDLILTHANKAELDALFRKWATEWESRWPLDRKPSELDRVLIQERAA